ncbi:MAG: phosphatidate cytidylyltransferase [Gammaproteobacteria bacterium]|nr:phosphatidate cytidylyltransferase [Gammaproteobacteria bacterium]
MLKHRVLTAVFLIPLVLSWLFLTPPVAFKWIIVGIVLLASWEWSNLLGFAKERAGARVFYALLLVGVLGSAFLLSPARILNVAVLFWLAIPIPLFLFYPKYSKGIMIQGLFGIAVLVPFGIGLYTVFLKPNGQFLLLYVLGLVWAADTSAYFFGKRFGRIKLAPRISPGKTVEGFVIQVLISMGLPLIFGHFFALEREIYAFIALSLVTVLFSVVGDLFESLLKRQRGVKDSGNWLPGHGGILDRIDSLTAAVPVFAVGYEYFLS